MKKWLLRILWIPVFVIAVLFLVANRQLVAVSLDPFNADAPAITTYALPLWFWLAAMLFTGFAAGAAGLWLSARPSRIKARADRRKLKTLKRETADLQAKLAAIEHRENSLETSSEPILLESADPVEEQG